MKSPENLRIRADAIPLKYFRSFEEARIILKPYPGLMLVDAAMLDRVREMMKDEQFANTFDLIIAPRM